MMDKKSSDSWSEIIEGILFVLALCIFYMLLFFHHV